MTVPGPRLTPTRITEPRAVVAITHPVRMQLLGELSRRGSARVVDLAHAVDQPANSVSFHLRQLARYGLVEADPERGTDGRERWWRMTSDRGFEVDVDAMREQDGGEAAVAVLRRVAEDHVVALHRTAHARSGRPGIVQDDFALRLSHDEVAQLRDEITDMLDRWGALSRSRAGSDDGVPRRAYYGVVLGAPVADIEATARAASGGAVV